MATTTLAITVTAPDLTIAVNKLAQGVLSLMATIADLKGAADAAVAANSALKVEVGALVTAVDGLIVAFQAIKGGLSAADQATLDAAIGEVTTVSTDLATATTTLTSEEGKVASA